MRPALAALIWLVCGFAVIAQEPVEASATSSKVDAPSIAKRDQPIRINHPAGAKIQAIYADVQDGTVVWSYLGEEHFQRAESYTVFAAPPGDYLITTGDSTILKVVEEGGPGPKPRPDPKPVPPDPDPKPDPEPDPDPKPEPIKIAWAVWVYEQEDAVEQIDETKVRQSIETRRFLGSEGIQFAAYDKDQTAAKPFLKNAESLPALFLMKDAETFTVYGAPESFDELKAMVKEVSGG